MDEALTILDRGVRAHRRGFFFLGGLLVVIGIIGLVAMHGGMELAGRALLGSYVLPPFGLAVIAYVLLKRFPALEALRSAPASVVWWYILDRGRNGMNLVVGLENGKLDELPLDLPTDAAPLEA